MRTCMTRMRAGTMIQCGTTAKCIVTSGGLNQIMASAQKDLGEMRTEASNMSIMQSPLSQMIMQSPMGDQVSQSSIRLSRRRRTVTNTDAVGPSNLLPRTMECTAGAGSKRTQYTDGAPGRDELVILLPPYVPSVARAPV